MDAMQRFGDAYIRRARLGGRLVLIVPSVAWFLGGLCRRTVPRSVSAAFGPLRARRGLGRALGSMNTA